MTITPEKELISPSSFLNLSPTPRHDLQQFDGLTLDYISCILMQEDSIENPDHAKLLQIQQPFAQILSASDPNTSGSPLPSACCMLASDVQPVNVNSLHIQKPSACLDHMDTLNHNKSMHMLSSMAFLKGMEEANRLLPKDNGRKNRFTRVGHLHIEEEADASERFKELMLKSYDMSPGEKQEVHAHIERNKKIEHVRKAKRGSQGVREIVLIDIERLLIGCAEAVSTNDRHSANKLLGQIKKNSSPSGDATERMAHYFVQGVEARLTGIGSRLYHSLTTKNASAEDLFTTYNVPMATCCFLKMTYLFSNKTIYNAAAGKKKLHIVHYGINDGFQWPQLLRQLPDREGGPPTVRLTGIASTRRSFRPASQLEGTRRRLTQFARQFGVPLEFHAMTAESGNVQAEDLEIHLDEVLVVNNIFHFRTLMDESIFFDKPNPKDMVLDTIRKMRPVVFVHAVINGSYSMAPFMTRFREAMDHYMAHFDIMDATMPCDSDERLLVERDIFARSAINIIACEDEDRMERSQNYRESQAWNQRAGLKQLILDPSIVQLLKDKVRKHYHKHFMIDRDGQWLLLAWTKISGIPKDRWKGLRSLLVLAAWEWWKERNRRVFSSKRLTIDGIMVLIKGEAQSWGRAGACGIGALTSGDDDVP